MPVYYNSDSMKKWRMDSTTTRKEFNEKNKPIIITDDDNKEKNSGFECKYCNRIIYTKFTDDSIWCNYCNAETIFEKDTKPVKKPLTADTMDTSEVNVYSVDNNDTASRTKYNRPVELQGGFKQLSNKVHFTSYSETIPGKGTYSWNEHSGSSFSSPSFNKGRRVPRPMDEEGDNETTE